MGFVDWFIGLFQRDPVESGLRMHSRKECAIRILSDVSHTDHYFRLANGLEMRNLCDLADALDVMDDATYTYHVDDVRNDFADWVREIVGDRVLGDKLQDIEDRDSAARAVNTRVDYFRRLLG